MRTTLAYRFLKQLGMCVIIVFCQAELLMAEILKTCINLSVKYFGNVFIMYVKYTSDEFVC